MSRSALLVCALLLPSFLVGRPAAAQVMTDRRVWGVVTLHNAAAPGDRWLGAVDIIVRSREGLGDLDVFATRAIVSRRVASRLAIGGGFAVVASRPAAGGTSMEYRPTFQMAWSGRGFGGALGLRTRLESRWLEGSSGPVGRAREQVRYSRPIWAGSRVTLALADEVFVHLNNTSRTARGIDQNRFSAGVGLPAGRVRAEFAYLHQYSPGHRGARARSNHVLSVSLAVPIA